jgi:hypothetical protein
MTVTAADKRAWALDNGWVLPDGGRLPAEVHNAYDIAHAGPSIPGSGDDEFVALPDDPPGLPADPEPVRAPKNGGGKAGRSKAAKVTDAAKRDMRGKVALMLTMPAAVFARRDEVCGAVLLAQVPEITDALVDILADSPDVVAFFTAGGGQYMKWIALATALEPVITIGWQHHVMSRNMQGGGPDLGFTGDTVPPDMDRYHAPAF